MGILSWLFGQSETKKRNSNNVMSQTKAKSELDGMTRRDKVRKFRALKARGLRYRTDIDLEYGDDYDMDMIFFYMLYAMDDILYAEENGMYLDDTVYTATHIEEDIHVYDPAFQEEAMPTKEGKCPFSDPEPAPVVEETVEPVFSAPEDSMPSAGDTMPKFESPAFDSDSSSDDDGGGDDGGCDCD